MSTSASFVRLQELLPQLSQSTQLPGNPYLRFQLTSGVTALLPMEYVQESLLVPEEYITPLPNMSEFVVGLMSSRDRVFCVIDLAQMVGISSPTAYARQYHVVVLHVSQFVSQPSTSGQELFMGMIVNRIQGITRVVPEVITSLQGNFTPSLTAYLCGSVMEKEQPLPILDTRAIATAPHLYEMI
jgi:twitching motility protein PilI